MPAAVISFRLLKMLHFGLKQVSRWQNTVTFRQKSRYKLQTEAWIFHDIRVVFRKFYFPQYSVLTIGSRNPYHNSKGHFKKVVKYHKPLSWISKKTSDNISKYKFGQFINNILGHWLAQSQIDYHSFRWTKKSYFLNMKWKQAESCLRWA